MYSFKYYHNKHTEHWFNLHVPDAMRVKERQQYFMDKWGQMFMINIGQNLLGHAGSRGFSINRNG